MDLPASHAAPCAETPSTLHAEERPQRRTARRVSRSLWVAGAISIAVHLALGGSALMGLHPGRQIIEPDAMGAVELLMVEQQGAGAPRPQTQAAPPAQPPPEKAAPPTPREAKAEPAPAGQPATPQDEGEPVPVPAPAPAPPPMAEQPAEQPKQAQQDQASKAEQQAPEAKPQKPLTFNLDGTDSLSNALVSGDHVIPASPDDRFRNRPPVYPREAVARGEQGVVVLLIHVSEQGTWIGSEIAESSGHPALDQAAQDAVRKWRFRPALRDSRAVPFDMRMRFIFEAN